MNQIDFERTKITTMAVAQRKSIAACLVLAVLLVTERFNVAEAHGMILDPPGRSSMWRFGFNVPENYDDNGLNCGGQGVRFTINLFINNSLNLLT